MGVSFVSLVNQRLACAGTLTTDLHRLGERAGPIPARALADGALFHLCCGYRHYLRELCDYYGVGYVGPVTDEHSARDALSQMDKTPAEINELCALAERPDSWLSQMHASFDQCWALPAGAAPPNLIAAKDLGRTSAVAVDAETLTHWLSELRALIERHRDSMVEC